MARRLTRDQRQMLLVAFGAVIGAVLFVIAAVIAGGDARDTARPALDDADYEPFPVNDYATVIGSIADEGPVIFPDLLGGTRPFALDLVDGDLVALHLLDVAGGATDADPCFVQWDRDADAYVGCDGEAVDPRSLGRFAVVREVDEPGDGDVGEEDGGSVSVDLRTILPPLDAATDGTDPSTPASA